MIHLQVINHTNPSNLAVGKVWRYAGLAFLFLGIVAAIAGFGTGTAQAASNPKYIISNAAGGQDCSSIGWWDAGTKTCTLNTNISMGFDQDAISIISDGVTLNGNGHSITGQEFAGFRSVSGIDAIPSGGAISISGVNIINVSVSVFDTGLSLNNCLNCTVDNGTFTANGYGIQLNNSSGCLVSGNTANDSVISTIPMTGIYLSGAEGNTISGNTASANGTGIEIVSASFGNIIKWNTLSANLTAGISINNSKNNEVYNNSFLGNGSQATVTGSGANVFYRPGSGNYWSNWSLPDINFDGIVDDAYVFLGGTDQFPLIAKNAWLDTLAPSTTTDAPGGWQKTDVTVNFSCTDNTGGTGCYITNYSVDSGAGKIGSQVTISDEGDHELHFSSRDKANNNETVKTVHVRIDKSNPIINNISPNGITRTHPSYVEADFSDAVSGIVSLSGKFDGSPMSNCITTSATHLRCDAPGVGDGPHEIILTMTDLAGNIGTASATWIFDQTAPSIIDKIPAAGSYINSNKPVIGFNYSDLTSGIDQPGNVRVTIDGTNTKDLETAGKGTNVIDATGIHYTPGNSGALGNGIHYISIEACDLAGNCSGAGQDWSFHTDTIPPVVSNIQPSGFISSTSATIQADLSDTGTSLINAASSSISLDGQAPLSGCDRYGWSISCSATGLTLGDHTITVTVDDNAGNHVSTGGSFSVGPPPGVGNVTPSGWINTTYANVGADFTNNGGGLNQSTASISVDGTTLAGSCWWPTTTRFECAAAGLAEGHHTIAASIKDNLGSTGSGSGSFDVDTTQPSFSNITPQGPYVTRTGANIGAAISETGSGLNVGASVVTLDGTALSGCTKTSTSVSCTVAGLSEGNHNFSVTAYDLAGNLQYAGTAFFVDSKNPIVSNIAPAGTVNNSSLTVEADLADDTSGGANSGLDPATAEVKLNGSVLSGCSVVSGHVSCPASGVTSGGYLIDVSVKDYAGNTGTGSGSFNAVVKRDYYWTWYDSESVGAKDWVLMANPFGSGKTLNFDLKIANNPKILDCSSCNNGVTSPGQSIAPEYDGLSGGPVIATSKTGDQAIVSQRILWSGNSLEEVLGTDADKLSNHFWWTWYDEEAGSGFKDWILIANPSDTAPVHYRIKIAGVEPTANSEGAPTGTIDAGRSVAPRFPGAKNGPVEVEACKIAFNQDGICSDPADVMASQRVLSNANTAFNEVPGIRDSDLKARYLWTWYDNKSLGAKDWVLIANPAAMVDGSVNPSPMYYEIWIGGHKVAGDDTGGGGYSPGAIAVGDKITPMFDLGAQGPVEVKTFKDQNHTVELRSIASQRIIWGPSFEEVPGYPYTALTNDYHWTWYDQSSGSGMKNWVLIANPTGSTVRAQVLIAGVPQKNTIGDPGPDNPDYGTTYFDIPTGQNVTPWFDTEIGGPVEVRGYKIGGDWANVADRRNVMTSQRVLYNGFFNETLGTVLS